MQCPETAVEAQGLFLTANLCAFTSITQVGATWSAMEDQYPTYGGATFGGTDSQKQV